MKDINLFKKKDSIYLKEISSKSDLENFGNCDGVLIRSSEKEARRIIESLRSQVAGGRWAPSGHDSTDPQVAGKPIVALIGGDDAFNRRAIESLKIDYLVSPEALTKFDNLKQRDSGLNHVVARIAKEKGIEIIVDMGDIRELISRSQVAGCRLRVTSRIAKVMQNVKVCRKVGCGVRIASFGKSKSDVVDELGRKSFGTTLGMSSSEVRDCVRF